MINFERLHQSQKTYSLLGYARIESPWTVTKAISNITRPEGAKDMEIVDKNKVLVASGEQSFLYLYLKGYLPLGKYQTTTPCFRDEPFDEEHSKYFIKNELIVTDSITQNSLEAVIDHAREFFSESLGVDRKEIIKVSQLGPNFDLEYKGIELGSYGIRSCKFLKWIYGTGCAEPRMQYVKNLIDGIPQKGYTEG